ncbi:MAG: hypothetical protein HC848_10865 [Limnobacter sp.]|nr:hypothetical protein [Limnobacter sp.]
MLFDSIPRAIRAGVVLSALLFYGHPYALGTTMYVCENPDGSRTYQNQDGGKGCRPLNLGPVTVIPSAPERKSPANATAKADPYAPSQNGAGDRRSAASGGDSGRNTPDFGAGSANGSGSGDLPGNTPSSAAGKSASRDSYDARRDRILILEEELRLERSKLASLEAEFNNGEPERQGNEKNYQRYLDRLERLKQDIMVTRENIGILENEITSISQ